QRAAVLTGYLLPGRLPLVVAEVDQAPRLRLGQKDPPAVFGHLDVVEVGPAVAVHADRRAQVHVARLEALGAHLAPPVEELGLPPLQGAQEPAIVLEVDIVGDALQIVGRRHHTLLRSNSARRPLPYT